MADEYVVSVVLEGDSTSLANATNKGAQAQKNLKTNTDSANIAFLAQVARYQAMTAALNQTIGGMNKLAGGLEAIGLEGTIGADGLRKLTKGLELIAGPAEIYLAYLTLSIALGKKDVATKSAQTTSTGILTIATAKLNAVMAMNPFILIAVAIVVLILALVFLEKKFGVITKTVDALNEGLFALEKILLKIVDVAKGVGSVFSKVGNAMNPGKGMGRLIAGAR